MSRLEVLPSFKHEGESVSVDEGHRLYELVKDLTGLGCVVEIGSFAGCSTIHLGRGIIRGGNDIPLFAIDPEPQPEFFDNIQKAGIAEIITFLEMKSEDAVNAIDLPIEMIFIDGDHRYPEVRKDYELWYPKVIKHGIIAFHDFGAILPQGDFSILDDILRWPEDAPNGPTKCILKDVIPSGRFDRIGQMETLTYFRKANH